MNGIHDLGGMHGFGPVRREPDEPVFHARFERRVFGLVALTTLQPFWNVDAFRHGIERLPPARYLRSSYYARWVASLEQLLIRSGVVTADEVESRARTLRREGGAPPAPARPAPAPAQGGPRDVARRIDARPRFAPGDAVRARNEHPAGHTRLPRYARGRRGVVERVYPACVFPDSHAHGGGEHPQYVYNVRFEGAELWGGSAEAASSVRLDCFESYLEPARAGAPEATENPG